MTPKEQAKDLFDMMLWSVWKEGDYLLNDVEAKQCAKIAARLLVKEYQRADMQKYHDPVVRGNRLDHWIKVEQEIDKI